MNDILVKLDILLNEENFDTFRKEEYEQVMEEIAQAYKGAKHHILLLEDRISEINESIQQLNKGQFFPTTKESFLRWLDYWYIPRPLWSDENKPVHVGEHANIAGNKYNKINDMCVKVIFEDCAANQDFYTRGEKPDSLDQLQEDIVETMKKECFLGDEEELLAYVEEWLDRATKLIEKKR